MIFVIVLALANAAEYALSPTTIVMENGEQLSVAGVLASELEAVSPCNPTCASSCLTTSLGYASYQCMLRCNCDNLITPATSPSGSSENEGQTNSLYPKTATPTYNEEKIKWWIKDRTDKLKNYEGCSLECDDFCQNIKGDREICKSTCTGKFCGEPQGITGVYYWIVLGLGAVFVTYFVSARLFRLRKNSQKSNIIDFDEVTVEYKRL